MVKTSEVKKIAVKRETVQCLKMEQETVIELKYMCGGKNITEPEKIKHMYPNPHFCQTFIVKINNKEFSLVSIFLYHPMLK